MTSERLFQRRTVVRFLVGAMSLGQGVSAMELEADDTGSWKMGLISDLHYGLADDALQRLDAFMQRVEQESPDAILQLGDFNYGIDSEPCMEKWNQFRGPKHHVLGNHDMDKTSKKEMIDRWSMPSNYYSFDHKGWHFVVLDRNHLRRDGKFVDYEKANFYVDSSHRGFADPEQLEWLKADLERTELPVVVFAHQGLGMSPDDDPDSPEAPIESVLAEAHRQTGNIKACLCGHHHVDRYCQKSGIHYLWINSASYHWVGSDYGRMAAYTDPLYTFLTFRPDHTIEVTECLSSWANPTPEQRGYPRWKELNTHIEARRF